MIKISLYVSIYLIIGFLIAMIKWRIEMDNKIKEINEAKITLKSIQNQDIKIKNHWIISLKKYIGMKIN